MKVVHKMIRPARVSIHKRLAIRNILKASYLVKNHYETILARHNINLRKLHVLQVLYEEFPESVSRNQIRHRIADKTIDLSRVIKHMEAARLIKQKPHHRDRSISDIGITQRGLKVLKELEKCENEINSPLAYVSEEEAKQIIALTQKIVLRLTEASLQMFVKTYSPGSYTESTDMDVTKA